MSERALGKVVASIMPVRKIPPKPKRHRWVALSPDRWPCHGCIDCGFTRYDASTGWRLYWYHDRTGKFVGSSAPPCDGGLLK